ncbi:hypothetical protein [Vibrio parahaemolyticus]|uniref:hypothetical protein n=1 Tax=Vibrio parahaemolyticus TaxID=670 RepID=UPI000813CB37|nr:hypothetical protein [Vibrio parahaemolyticus]OCP68359.1 hypothetical protein AKH08_16215 [Vibrio parahaemolyticus]
MFKLIICFCALVVTSTAVANEKVLIPTTLIPSGFDAEYIVTVEEYMKSIATKANYRFIPPMENRGCEKESFDLSKMPTEKSSSLYDALRLASTSTQYRLILKEKDRTLWLICN